MAEYIDKSAEVHEGYLTDWYIESVAEYNDERLNEPRWTEAHIEELTNDFIVIPKDTPATDVAPEIRKLLRVRESAVDIYQAGFEYGVNIVWVKINKIPAADVAPVVHGHWDDSFDGITPFCSACGRSHHTVVRTPKFCPNCGAKMDEEVNDT